MKSKLLNELPELLEQNIISNDVASNITAYYQSKTEEQPNRLFTIFGVFGATLVGLGIMLIVAHNWDNFSKLVKTAFAFLPMVLGQLFSGYSILKKKSQAWKESSGTFLFFAIGASIALISQIYNIPGDLSAYLLMWIVLGLPLIYVLNSKAVTLLTVVFATYYACELGYNFGFGSKAPWLYFAMILGTIPFYVNALKKRPSANTTSIFNWLYALSLIIVLGTFINANWPFGFLMYAMLFGVLYNLGKIPIYNILKLRYNSFVVLGALGTVILLLILSFNILWKEMQNELIALNSPEMLISVVLFSCALGLLFYSRKDKVNSKFNLFQYVFILFALVFIIGRINYGIGTVFTNIIVLFLAVFAIKIGVKRVRFSILNYGLLIITALIVCRFFDTDMSFVLRGILFVSVGLGFFSTNFFMLKKQKVLNHKTLK
jgi:uncharacterized membrane protein